MEKSLIFQSKTKIIFPLLIPSCDFFPRSFCFQEKEENSQSFFIQQGKYFLIEISGDIPRRSLIRKLLLLLFPQGINQISLRKIKRSSLIELFTIIGENLDFIRIYMTEEIKNQWMILCYKKLSLAKRVQHTDYKVLLFIYDYFNQKL
jgi:hypothetical protein